MDDQHSPDLPLTLGAALARLPLETPPHSAWPMLAQRLAPDRRRSRWTLAIAAGLLALLLLPRGLPPPTPTAANPPARGDAASVASQSVELAALMSESARLERLVAATSDDGASSASTAALSVELEDRLRALDSQLEASRDPAAQLSLWQRRVRLLRNVAAVETSRHYLASEGRNLDVALVAAY
jgi:hypothetical protein